MERQQFLDQLEARIAKYDLLCHPFYQAWAAGELTRQELCSYAQQYYPHVKAFPTYLAELAMRLEDGDLRRAVLANMADEKGTDDATSDSQREHADLWLDFVEGMGGQREAALTQLPAIKNLTGFFHRMASEGTPEEALAAFYAYESQVPRVAKEKARGLLEMYGASQKTCAYFTLHTTADVFHSNVWKKQLEKRLEAHPEAMEQALRAAENAAKSLWQALDGIEESRKAPLAA